MANRRMLASDIFMDDFIGRLNYFERLVWIGLITSVADDQGRAMDNPAIIRSFVFLYDQIEDGDVETAIRSFSTAGKIARYVSGNKHLIQIVNWWKYQTPAWASPSKYPAPNGWVDRAKYHTAGNKIIMVNWDKPGGYIASYVPAVDSAIEEGDVKGEGEGEGKGDGKGEAGAPAPDPFTDMTNLIQRKTGYLPVGGDIQVINEFISRGVIEADIDGAMAFLKDKKQVHGAADLQRSVYVAMAKRIQGSNGHDLQLSPADQKRKLQLKELEDLKNGLV